MITQKTECDCNIQTVNKIPQDYFRYSMIVVDMDLEWIKENIMRLHGIPVIIIVNRDEDFGTELLSNRKEYGIVDYIYRPFNYDTLSAKINRCIISRKYSNEGAEQYFICNLRKLANEYKAII